MPDASNKLIDIFLLFYVLHDLKNPDSIIREVTRVIKPNGVLLAIDQNFDTRKLVSTIGYATKILSINGTILISGNSDGKDIALLSSKRA